ncbi:MAG: T9SS type A sorting domain-containing protein, partial [Bacteroidota bacterium]
GEAELTINGTGTVTVTDAGDDGIRMESASNRLDNRGTLIINGSTNEAIAGNEVRCYNGSVFRVEGTVSAAMEWRSGSRIEPGSSPGCLALVPDAPVGTTLAGATYAVELEGNTPCTGYDQMTFEDDLTITDAVLELSGDYVPSLNETFTIVDLDDNYTLTGTFANLAEGATLFFNTTTLQISYVGGTGNDIVLTCTEVPAVPLTWTGAEDGNWGNVNNWDGGTVPGAGDAVIVPPAPNAAVVNTGFARAGSIAVAGGELTIAGGTILIVQDQPTGITVTDGGSVTVNGPLQVTGQPGTGILVADGQFTVAGGSTTASSLIVQEAGSLTVAEDAEVTLEDNGGGLVVGGPTQLDGELFVGPQTGFGVQIVAPFTVGPAGLFALDQTVLFLADTLVIAGELTLEDAEFGGILSLGANDYLDVQEGGSCTITRPGNTGLSFNGGGTVRVAGRLSIIDGADEGVFFETGAWTITETGEVFVTDCGGEGILLDRSTILLDNSGLLSVTGSGDEALRGGQLLNRATSTLRANGNLNGNVDVVSGARIEPGASPGCLTFQQSLYLDGVTLAVEIDGSTACTGYDQLVFADTLDLSGSILELSGDYVPALGDVFTIIAESGSANQLGTFTGLPEGGTVDFNGATLAITYQGGAGDDVMLTAIAVLPLDLLSFTGEARDKTNLLTWKTANEEDFSHFEVERSSADRWETIGIIAGGQSGQYSFEDAATTAYYRLKMIDLDGTFSYSEVVYLENFSGANAGAMLVYPNPSTGRFTVDLSEASLPADRGGELRLVDLHGREIWARRVSLDQAIELSHTLAGVYLLMLITDDNQTQTQRIVIH